MFKPFQQSECKKTGETSFGMRPMCETCKTMDTTMWRKGSDGEVLCNSCGLQQLNGGKGSDEANAASSPNNGKAPLNGGGGQFASRVRKSSRLKPSKYKCQAAAKALATKGKNRRVIFKKNPTKAPASLASVVTSDYIFYDGIYWQVGDIVSLMDHDGGIYYAQIRGFLQDQYCEKSAVITWLLPTVDSPTDTFHPATYILGPEEDFPRKMECYEFVCRAPSEYYKAKSAPYPTRPVKPELGFIWTSLGGEIRPVPSREEIFGSSDCELNPSLSSGKTKAGKRKAKEERKGDEGKEHVVSGIKTEKKGS